MDRLRKIVKKNIKDLEEKTKIEDDFIKLCLYSSSK